MLDVMKNKNSYEFGNKGEIDSYSDDSASDRSKSGWNAADFQGVWDATRIIDSICELANIDNGYVQLCNASEGSVKIKLQRLKSALKAYNRNLVFDHFRQLMGDSWSQEKKKEMKEILYKLSSKSRVDAFFEVVDKKDEFLYYYLFETTLKSYLVVNKIANPYRGVIECSLDYNLMLSMVQDFNKRNILLMRRLLVLLLGDNYDVPVTEVHLLEEYNYPAVTDSDLYQIEIKEKLADEGLLD